MTAIARKTETRAVPMLDVRAAPVPDSYNQERRTVTFIASTGARGLRRRYWDEDYYEELEVSESAVRMDRFNNGAPFLNSHNNWDVDDVLGVVERAWIEDSNLMVEVRFSQREAVAPILADIADGILRHVSVGYNVHEWDITEKTGEIDVRRAVDWEPIELSIVPIAFDDDAVSRSAERETSQAKFNYRAVASTTEEGSAMTTKAKQEPAAETRSDEGNQEGLLTEEQVQARVDAALAEARGNTETEATRAERERVTQIQRAVRTAKLPPEFADEMIREGVEIDDARQRIIDKWADQDESEETRTIRTGVDHSVVTAKREAVVSAILHRADPQNQLAEGAREYAGMSLLRLCEDLLVGEGVSVRGLSSREIATRALTTSDLPNITGSAMNRSLLSGYESAPRTFVGVFRRSSSADFRDINRVRLSGAPTLEEVKEDGEFKYGKVSDEKETYSLATYGKILPFTRQSIINDDLDALSRIPMMFGRAAADLESDLVWGILPANAALGDGTALFHSDHGNLAGSGAAITVASVGAGRGAMRVQTGIEGRLINVMPAHLIVGAEKETELDQFLTNITPNTQANAQPSTLRSLNPVIEPRLSGNAWYLAADYNQVDTIEYCYLEGEQGVYIETAMGFDVDGVKVKARHDFAAKAIDYRGLYKNPGE